MIRTVFKGHARTFDVARQPIPPISKPSDDEPKLKPTSAGREVNVTAAQTKTVLAYLKWSETMITFDRTNHADNIQPPGRFPLIVSATIRGTRLTNVLMDEGSGLNILYLQAYDAIGLSRAAIWPTNAPIYGIVPGARISPLRRNTLPVTFGGRPNF
jgi:hypothetical protein